MNGFLRVVCLSAIFLPVFIAGTLPEFSWAQDASSFQDGYQQQDDWKKVQAFLPSDLHFTEQYQPEESWWYWKGHKVHLDQFRNPDALYRIVLLHGVGTNGRQMSLIAGGPLWRRGFDTVSLDLPGYGVTQVDADEVVTYDTWVNLVSDFVDAEKKRDPRPIVLYGLSAGGMLTYHVAAKNRNVAGIVGMTFLDQRLQQVRDATARNLFMSRVGGFSASLVGDTVLGRMKAPMWLTSKMSTLVNDPRALDVFLDDRTSAGNWVSIRFLKSYLNYVPVVEPEAFTTCPVLLTQPAKDAWTPITLSTPFLARLEKVPVKMVMLDNAGHYPLEQPGLGQMVEFIAQFINALPSR